MRWVTWERVAVDRMACAWLIRRFIDAQAEFLFVPTGQKPLPAEAEPFDIPGVRLSHHRGHCTFHTMLREYAVNDPVLQRIARIVDEADVVQEVAVEPVAPGLDLLCRGLRQISPDDYVALERGALLYDALYAQLARETTTPAVEKERSSAHRSHARLALPHTIPRRTAMTWITREDDHMKIALESPLYDALYAFCQHQVPL